ncbi:MAG: hypothetical protein AAGI14_07205 [Pseudomonadota bacterium]
MTVSTRNTFLAGAGALALLTIGSVAYAGGGMSGGGVKAPGGGTHVPGAGMGGHGVVYGGGHGPSGGGACCGKGPKGQSVMVPGVNVAGPNIVVNQGNFTVNQGSIIRNQNTFLNTTVAGSNQQGFFVSGGGGFFSTPGVAPSSIGSLNVEGNVESFVETVTEQVATTEEFCEDSISVQRTIRPVQAVCIDDKGTPHPASQVIGDQRVSGTYGGELFRCMAGTNMQVTLGKFDHGKASFAHGETFSCNKGEALVHRAGGNLSCAPQIPMRSCNERSLLRRHGPGIKLIEGQVKTKTCVPKTRTVMKPVQRQVERTRQVKGQPMIFDGGVGQGVN